MKGNNEIRLSQAEMQAAVQYYLDNVLLKAKVKVTSVSHTSGGYFCIMVKEVDETVEILDELAGVK
jgi:hypothetical protein